ncbi:MAG: alanine--tRNA ligase [Candidatus Omnitrophica bacterium]|nr:alanine--tRNA ligase [Candidatus Omnitrophota bacterium]
MNTDEIRSRFLAFFEKKGHKVVASDSLLPHNDPTLLFTGAGMNQFKEYFLGLKKDFTRAASSQKCLRTGDLDNVGRTAYHHSFFEMLGNFSFGDYFKKEAIVWAWEFLTKELGILSERLQVSVHEKDSESYKIWHTDLGIAENVLHEFGDKDNFWPSNAPKDGPNGPCGYCSEIFFDQGADYGCKKSDCSPACDCGRFAEVWNLVFTQYERKDGGKLDPLPSKNIDTGMGLERIACVMQGKKNNFEIDIFSSLIQAVTDKSTIAQNNFKKEQTSVHAIVDHIRACTFAISDGAYPSNEGRGYVIRKLLRRSIWHADSIGVKRAFLFKIVPLVVTIFKEVYPELEEQKTHTIEIVQAEEERFLNTLEDGRNLLDALIKKAKREKRSALQGEDVFKLYDTYGFPDELTKLKAQQEGIMIEQKVFDQLMEEQRERAKKTAVISDAIFTSSELEKQLSQYEKTKFCGYRSLEAEATVCSVIKEGKRVEQVVENEYAIIILDITPCYAESGGQVGDQGTITHENSLINVVNTQKKDDVFYHEVHVMKGSLTSGAKVHVSVNSKRRNAIIKNHTATHLLQAALREVLGTHVRQLGSLVSDEKLRFDFSYQKALTEEQKRKIDACVNQKITEGIPLSVDDTTAVEAKKKGALAFFGDKYGDSVRMVSIGDFSKELCGGTHLNNTKQIGQFKIISEGSVASGIRRIEAITGERIQHFVQEQKQKELAQQEKTQERKKKQEDQRTQVIQLTNSSNIEKIIKVKKEIKGYNVIVYACDGVDQGGLRELYDALKTKVKKGIIVLFSRCEDKVMALIALTKDLGPSTISANGIAKELNKRFEGSGGGKKEMAFAGIKQVEKMEEAKAALPDIIKGLCDGN